MSIELRTHIALQVVVIHLTHKRAIHCCIRWRLFSWHNPCFNCPQMFPFMGSTQPGMTPEMKTGFK